MFGKIKKRLFFGFILSFLYILLFSNITSAQDVNYSNFRVLYDVRGDVSWQKGQSVDISLTNGSIVLFDVSLEGEETEICQLILTNVQKTTRIIAIFALECFGQRSPPFSITKGTSREIDVNYDDVNDIILSFNKMDIRTDKLTVSLRKAVELPGDKTSLILAIIIIATLFLIFLDAYYYIKINRTAYGRIKTMLARLENYLSLKNYEKARTLRDEMNTLYKGLRKKQKKEFNNQISALFKQFRSEEELVSRSKL